MEAHEGFKVKYVDVKKDAILTRNILKELVSDKVGLVTCMYVNNVTGQIQPIPQMAKVIKNYPKAHFHVDA